MFYKFIVFSEGDNKMIDSGSIAGVFYLDFKKAFDKVPHQRLLW